MLVLECSNAHAVLIHSWNLCRLSLSATVLLSFLKVWKQKGEEYRVTGYGGWSWISKTYVPRFDPRLPGNTNANYRKELEGLRFGYLALIIVAKRLLNTEILTLS